MRRAKVGFVTRVNGQRHHFAKGDVVPAEVARGREALLEPVERATEPVEQATAAPGETRTLTSSPKKSTAKKSTAKDD